ncbi:MAG: tetratricopeptide repeat protein [Bacteroidetes bacterium]|nr:tetratricopeptide repeat protein [Bacteroidota bacterium]
MKSVFLPIALLFLHLSGFCQQTPFHGVVTVMNSLYEKGKVEYVPFATVEAQVEKIQPAVTGSDGQFKLVLIGVSEKTRFYFQVKKEGLDVVNIDQLEAVCGQKESAKIFMAKPQYIADFRSKVYNVGKTSAQKSLEKKQQQLLTDYAAEKAKSEQTQERIGQLESELATVFDQLTKVEKFANDLADKYQRINLDDASEQFREAFRLFQEGDLAGALTLLNKSFSHVAAILAERQRIEALKKEVAERDSLQQVRTEETMQELRLKADLHKAQNEWDSVEICYRVLLELDSLNLKNLWEVAGFFQLQNDIKSSLLYYNRALHVAKTLSDSAALLGNLCGLYSVNVLEEEAIDCFKKAFIIHNKLVDMDPNIHKLSLAILLNTLGNFVINDSTQAMLCYTKALSLVRDSIDKNFEDSLYLIAVILNDMGNLQNEFSNYGAAKVLQIESLEAIRVLLFIDSIKYTPDKAAHLNNLANTLGKNNEIDSARAYYEKVLTIQRALTENNPYAYLNHLATTLNNYGSLLAINFELMPAKVLYEEALSYRRQLAQINPRRFNQEAARTSIYLSNLYGDLLEETSDVSYQEEGLRLLDEAERYLSVYPSSEDVIIQYYAPIMIRRDYFKNWRKK